MGWGAEVGADRDLVAHGAGHDEQGGFVAGESGNVRFEVVGGGIFEEDVVHEGGVLDGFEHGCCWCGHGV